MSANVVGEAIAKAFEYLPDRDELLAEVRRATISQLEDPVNVERQQELAGVVFHLQEKAAAKALELGLIPQAELDRIQRENDARRAVFIAMNN
jgi:hypothetical protein